MDGLMGLFVLVGTLRPAGPVQSARAFLLQPAPARAVRGSAAVTRRRRCLPDREG
jgi:hypothetical protein